MAVHSPELPRTCAAIELSVSPDSTVYEELLDDAGLTSAVSWAWTTPDWWLTLAVVAACATCAVVLADAEPICSVRAAAAATPRRAGTVALDIRNRAVFIPWGPKGLLPA